MRTSAPSVSEKNIEITGYQRFQTFLSTPATSTTILSLTGQHSDIASMGTCQSRTLASPAFEKDGGKSALGTPYADRGSLSPKVLSVTTPRNGRILHVAKKPCQATHLVSPSEETIATVPPTPFPCSFADENSSFSSVGDNLEKSWNSPPLVLSESETKIIQYVSASTICGDNPNLSTTEDYGDIPIDHGGLFRSAPLSPRALGTSMNSKKREEEAADLCMLNSPITKPESVVYRSAAPLIAPCEVPSTILSPNPRSYNSVDPQTLAHFNRLKIQVQLAEQNELRTRRKAKLEDRLEDVKGYRNLWIEFESIKHRAAGTSGDELADNSKNPSMKLHDPESWYFDFNPLQTLHINGQDDDNSVSSVSLLSEVTMEVQRKYYQEKSRERSEKCKDKLHETSHDLYTTPVVDDEPIASILSTESCGTIAKARGKSGNYGSVTPRTCTGRSRIDNARHSIIHIDGASIMPNHYVEPENIMIVASHSEGVKNGVPRDDLKSTTVRSTPQSCLHPSAPLSSQLEVFAQSVPSVQIEDAKSGVVHWREFPDSCGRTPATARRLQGDFEQDKSKSSKQIEWEPHSVSKPVLGGCGIGQRKMKGFRIENNSPNNLMSTRDPKLSRNTPEGQSTFRNHSSYDAMSPSQFLIMSSSFVRGVDDGDAENNLCSPFGYEKLRLEDTPIEGPKDSELQVPRPPQASTKQDQTKEAANIYVHPNISILSTDAFLKLSS